MGQAHSGPGHLSHHEPVLNQGQVKRPSVEGYQSFTAQQRTKEIGVRKVLGASLGSIMELLSKEFTFCVLAANLFAWPLAYIAMNRWLENFAYRTSTDAGIFVLASLLTFAFAMLTVGYQILRAARANPVDSLRYE